jgi:hypothetical protein
MEQNIVKVKGKNGGSRPGAGRPKGGTNKITAIELIQTADRVLGKPFIQSLLEGYQDSITQGDRRVRVMYEKMIVDKVISDKQEVEVSSPQDQIQARAEAFAEALAAMNKVASKKNKES